VDAINADIAALDQKIAQQVAPFAATVDRLDEIPGIGLTAAHAILAEIGLDMSRFPTAAHLTSWAGLTPRHRQSDTTVRRGRSRSRAPGARAPGRRAPRNNDNGARPTMTVSGCQRALQGAGLASDCSEKGDFAFYETEAKLQRREFRIKREMKTLVSPRIVQYERSTYWANVAFIWRWPHDSDSSSRTATHGPFLHDYRVATGLVSRAHAIRNGWYILVPADRTLMRLRQAPIRSSTHQPAPSAATAPKLSAPSRKPAPFSDGRPNTLGAGSETGPERAIPVEVTMMRHASVPT
jgi:hypothetical protein